jgi:hypothetical protein
VAKAGDGFTRPKLADRDRSSAGGLGAFPSLGEHRREALKLAAGFRGEEAVEPYVWDRAGSDN